MRVHLMALLALCCLPPSSAFANDDLPYCAAPPTRAQASLCASHDASLQARALRVESLAADLKARPNGDGVAKDLVAFYKGLDKRCMRLKAAKHAACLYGEINRQAVTLSKRVQAEYSLTTGPAAGLYTFGENPGILGELVFVRHGDGTASFNLETTVESSKRQCAVNVGVVEHPADDAAAYAWSPFDQPECAMTFKAGDASIVIEATAACEAHFCGNGAVFSGRWTEKR